MAAKVTLRGLVDLKQRLAMLRTQEEIDKITFRGTFGISKEMRDAAVAVATSMLHKDGNPDSGNLIRNIAMKRLENSPTQRGYTVGVRAGAPSQIKSGSDPYYWWWVHFGTARMEPRPFFTIAFRQIYGRAYGLISQAALKAIAQAADRAIKRYGRGK